MKSFVLRPRIMSDLWKLWGASPPSDAVARSHLKIDLGLGEQQARTLLSIYKDNLNFADIKGDDRILEIPEAIDADDEEAQEMEAASDVGSGHRGYSPCGTRS